jgi:adenylate kinase family enzyme
MKLSAEKDNFIPGPRIVVVGVTGCGKTTTARRLAQILSIPHIELDALHWEPSWQKVEVMRFRQSVEHCLSGDSWVTDGNYSKARDLIWPRATTLVWLDYSLPVILSQLFIRTMQRIITQEELWGNNRETFRGQFFSKDSLFLWALTTYKRHRNLYPRLLALPEHAHLQVIHLMRRKDSAQWLNQLRETVQAHAESIL